MIQGFSEFLQPCTRPQNSVTSLYGRFSTEKLPYKAVTELWGLMQFCKVSAKPCSIKQYTTPRALHNYFNMQCICMCVYWTVFRYRPCLNCFPAFVGIKPHIAVHIKTARYRTSTDRIAIWIKPSRGKSLTRRHCNSQEGCCFQHIQIYISRNNELRSTVHVWGLQNSTQNNNVTCRAEHTLKSSDCTATSYGDTGEGE